MSRGAPKGTKQRCKTCKLPRATECVCPKMLKDRKKPAVTIRSMFGGKAFVAIVLGGPDQAAGGNGGTGGTGNVDSADREAQAEGSDR